MSTAALEKQEKAAANLGLDVSTDPEGVAFDITETLLRAANYKKDEDTQAEVHLQRRGIPLFTVHLHPLGTNDLRQAHKLATTYGRNPQGPKYPKIEVSFDDALYGSWLIYLATTPEDQEKIWGNKTVKAQLGLAQNVETIDAVLRAGEKIALLNKVFEVSGLEDDAIQEDKDIAKN